MKMSIDLRVNRCFIVFFLNLPAHSQWGLISSNAMPDALSAPQIKSYRQGQLKTYFGGDFFYATQSFDSSGNSGA
jgi:hypothetical protein